MMYTAAHWLVWLRATLTLEWAEHASGYVASALVLTTFLMETMRLLRMTAIASNVAFIIYAATTDIRPVLLLHSILLPVNVVRLMQIELARKTARRLLDGPVPVPPELGEPRFLSHTALADPDSALPLAEREQERVAELLAARLPGEAAHVAQISPEAAAAAARRLLDQINQFLVALVTQRPSREQISHIAGLRSRNEVLRALLDTLGELATQIQTATPGAPAKVAHMIGEGLSALLLCAHEAASSHEPRELDLLLQMTGDRSSLVEKIRQRSIADTIDGSEADHLSVYAVTSLYERTVWLLRRYGRLLPRHPDPAPEAHGAIRPL